MIQKQFWCFLQFPNLIQNYTLLLVLQVHGAAKHNTNSFQQRTSYSLALIPSWYVQIPNIFRCEISNEDSTRYTLGDFKNAQLENAHIFHF